MWALDSLSDFDKECQLLFALFIPLKQFLCLTGCLILHGIVLEIRHMLKYQYVLMACKIPIILRI